MRPLLPREQGALFEKATWITFQKYYRSIWREEEIRFWPDGTRKETALDRCEETKRDYFVALRKILSGAAGK